MFLVDGWNRPLENCECSIASLRLRLIYRPPIMNLTATWRYSSIPAQIVFWRRFGSGGEFGSCTAPHADSSTVATRGPRPDVWSVSTFSRHRSLCTRISRWFGSGWTASYTRKFQVLLATRSTCHIIGDILELHYLILDVSFVSFVGEFSVTYG